MSPIFYAFGRSRTPVTVSIITVLVNAGLNVVLVRVPVPGAASAPRSPHCSMQSHSSSFCATICDGIHDGRILGAFARITAAAGAMGLVAAALNEMLEARWPGGALVVQIVRLSITIGVSLVVLDVSVLAAPHPRVQRRNGARRTPARPTIPMKLRSFGLHPTVLILAGTHFIVDGFGNILAPLLPLLILNLNPRSQPLARRRRSSARELSRPAWLRLHR